MTSKNVDILAIFPLTPAVIGIIPILSTCISLLNACPLKNKILRIRLVVILEICIYIKYKKKKFLA